MAIQAPKELKMQSRCRSYQVKISSSYLVLCTLSICWVQLRKFVAEATKDTSASSQISFHELSQDWWHYPNFGRGKLLHGLLRVKRKSYACFSECLTDFWHPWPLKVETAAVRAWQYIPSVAQVMKSCVRQTLRCVKPMLSDWGFQAADAHFVLSRCIFRASSGLLF